MHQDQHLDPTGRLKEGLRPPDRRCRCSRHCGYQARHCLRGGPYIDMVMIGSGYTRKSDVLCMAGVHGYVVTVTRMNQIST